MLFRHPKHPYTSIAIALVLLLLLLLVACGPALHKITISGDAYFDKWTDTSYVALPACYEPLARGEEYGKVDLSGMTHMLYKIEGLSPVEYLCSAYGDVYHNVDVSVTPFANWDISAAFVCTNTSVVISELSLRPDDALHASVLTSLQSTIVEGTNLTYPSYLEPERIYTLRFTSNNAPNLYYSIKLIRYAEDVYDVIENNVGEEVEVNFGRCFLYDRYSGRFVATDDTIFRLLDGEEVTLPETGGEGES